MISSANGADELRAPITAACSRTDNPVAATFMPDIKREARRIETMAKQLLSATQISNHKDHNLGLRPRRERSSATAACINVDLLARRRSLNDGLG